MKGKAFVDSNVWLYLLGNIEPKKRKALELLGQQHTISTQVLSENANVCRRKLSLDITTTEQHISNLITACTIASIQSDTVLKALTISNRYGFSYYDSLIVATAIESGCDLLFSEDLQDGQVIDRILTIVNPFKGT
jgi:predicted nucleic acid-binding protein